MSHVRHTTAVMSTATAFSTSLLQQLMRRFSAKNLTCTQEMTGNQLSLPGGTKQKQQPRKGLKRTPEQWSNAWRQSVGGTGSPSGFVEKRHFMPGAKEHEWWVVGAVEMKMMGGIMHKKRTRKKLRVSLNDDTLQRNRREIEIYEYISRGTILRRHS